MLQEITLPAPIQAPLPAVTAEPSLPAYLLDPDMEMPTREAEGYEYIGTLDIPSLELSLPIMSEQSPAGLKIAPGRYKGSAYQDDLILAGHNYRSHFGPLARMEEGEQVLFTDVDGNAFTYAVSDIQELPGTALEEMEAGDWVLTFFTCTPGWQSSLTVRCVRTEDEAPK